MHNAINFATVRQGRGGSDRSRGAGSSRGGSGTQDSQSSPSRSCCVHYVRYCMLLSPCCQKVVCCHIGHDEMRCCGRKLDRSQVTQIVCAKCSTVQDLGRSCVKCKASFGRKFCEPCRLWYADNGVHCDDCGICRKGRRCDYMHCPICRICLETQTVGGHTCSDNAFSSRCPRCNEGMQNSSHPCVLMRCGHAMHSHCFKEHVAQSYACPRADCRKSVGDMSSYFCELDSLVERDLREMQQRGERVSNVSIHCFDCRRRSVTPNHGRYRKCGHSDCNSYNTALLPSASGSSSRQGSHRSPHQSSPRGRH